MEHYLVVDTMCPGSYGMILFVKDKDSGLEHTLKKVECLDESRANQALREALCLINVNHPNIVRYRELFISWDKSMSSVMLSMVMDCPCISSLKAVIASHREQKERFKNKVIHMFLGQMVDALAYLDNRNILHRNLKPSNILMTDGLVFRICDFGTATVTGDRAKLQIRIKDSAKCWMAPESVRLLQWSNKSDIWSLGCVLLDVLTCHMFDEEASLSQLFLIKKDLIPLDRVMSKDLHKLLTMMFSHSPKKRASVWMLVNEAFVKDCLILCGSSLHTMKKTLPRGVTGPPFHEGFDSVLEFMMTYTDIEDVQLSVLSYLLKKDKNALERVSDVVEAVTSAMMSHTGSACVQLKSCQVLQQLLTAGEHTSIENSSLYGEDVISHLLKAVQNHSKHVDLLVNAFQVLFLVSKNGKACDSIVKLGCAQEVLKTLRANPQKKDIVIPSCRFLWNLLANGIPYTASVESMTSAAETVCSVGEMHLQDAVVTECLCAALQSLTMHGLFEEKDVENATLLLINALRIHPNHSGIVKHVFIVMVTLVKCSEKAALRLLTPNGESGVSLILTARGHHPDDRLVTENFCHLLNQLVQQDAVAPELLAESVQEELEHIVKQFESTTDIALLAQETLSNVMSLNNPEPAVKNNTSFQNPFRTHVST
ncbi:serine/threonine kinase-like domain-containing protein STKLD1 [Pygocentrus nattereri]|uniref:serine/threonine kinase-like domain-containing protein STKLD1 n=1 Tax=Pygocentrus nattereri TaxID=42514 RepID=UPI001890F5B3|nr:serine/threonine kinase-like domain-containing protein STKLD1 [Pygocentrus nattereri]